MPGQTSGKFLWTDEAVADLKRRWAKGESAGWIASEIPGFSRSAVIGKLHRLGLLGNMTKRVRTPRSDDVLGRKIQRRRVRKAAGLDTGIKFTATVAADAPVPLMLSIVQLNETTCRWPIGDPQGEAFAYCGAHASEQPYCKFHRARGFAPTNISAPTPPANGAVARPIGYNETLEKQTLSMV